MLICFVLHSSNGRRAPLSFARLSWMKQAACVGTRDCAPEEGYSGEVHIPPRHKLVGVTSSSSSSSSVGSWPNKQPNPRETPAGSRLCSRSRAGLNSDATRSGLWGKACRPRIRRVSHEQTPFNIVLLIVVQALALGVVSANVARGTVRRITQRARTRARQDRLSVFSDMKSITCGHSRYRFNNYYSNMIVRPPSISMAGYCPAEVLGEMPTHLLTAPVVLELTHTFTSITEI